MNPLHYVRDAEFLNFGPVKYVRSFEYLSQAFQKPFGPFAFCIQKPSGKLSFTINSLTHLHFEHDISLDLMFNGKESKPDADGNQTILWTIDQPVFASVPFEWASQNLEFYHVHGSFLTAVREKPTPRAFWCEGAVRDFHVELEMIGKGNQIQATGGVGEIPATNNYFLEQLFFDAADESEVQARIEVIRDECGISGVPGGEARFRVQLSGLKPFQSPPTYLWTAANIIGSDKSSMVRIKLPKSGAAVPVKVRVKVGSTTITDEHKYTPMDPGMVEIVRLYCKIRGEVRRNMFVDPLWDPLRDLISRPPTRAESAHSIEVLDRMSSLVAQYRIAASHRAATPRRAVRKRTTRRGR